MTQRIPARRRALITQENSRWWTLGAMCFALFMIMLDNTVVNVALPSIQRDLHASLQALEWTMNAYTLTFAVLMVTGGRLGDIFGRRRLFLFGVAVFGVSSLAIGLAPNDTVLVGFRAVQGIGAAFMMPATLSIITQAFPAAQRGTAIGTWARGRCARAGDWARCGRILDRGRQLARDLLHQPADRGRGGRGDAVRRARVAR
jgi:MFS family permease